jgi:hypothetical protein
LNILRRLSYISVSTILATSLLAGSAWAQQPSAPPTKKNDAGRGQNFQQPSPPQNRFQIGPFGNRRRDAGARPGQQAGGWLRKYHNLPPQEQQKLLESDPQFQKLSPDRQEQLRDRLKEFNSRSPEQQQRMLDRMAKFENLSDAQKQQLEALHQRMHEIPEDRRGVVRREFQLLQQMTPDQRQRVMNSDSYRTTFSDNEREIIKGMADIQGATAAADNENPPPDLD